MPRNIYLTPTKEIHATYARFHCKTKHTLLTVYDIAYDNTYSPHANPK